VKAVLRRLHSPDVDLRSWQPQSASWEVFVQAFLGPSDGPGEESFDFTVCSPNSISDRLADGPVWTSSTLVLNSWDYEEVVRAVSRLCDECAAMDWHTVAIQLARQMDWEFTNYSNG
jgi:hypothetical protein